jgi:hypothetical protein
MESIEKLEIRKQEEEHKVKDLALKYKISKGEVQRIEIELRKLKTYRNKTYSQLLATKKNVIKISKRIKTLPSQIRSQTKANMGKAINKILGGQQ